MLNISPELRDSKSLNKKDSILTDPEIDEDSEFTPLTSQRVSEDPAVLMTEQELARTFVNSIFIFLIQMVLVLYALYQIFFADEFI